MSWFYAKDVNLYFEDRGKGIPLVFIHPPVLTGMNFKYQLEELAKDFRVIAPD
ncbi:MAG TPA: alpha/beta hydrolase, partial [Paenibacillaceae bacterium]|nr:alpha/beta hydrolase [Paenibacillaceae bacterium]